MNNVAGRGMVAALTWCLACAASETARAVDIPPAVEPIPLLLEASEPFTEVPPHYRNLRAIRVDVERIKQPAQVIRINLPDQEAIDVGLERWSPREGYIQIYNKDDPLRPITIPDPNAGPEDFSWRWYGREGPVSLGLTLVDGVLAGRVWIGARHYDLAPRTQSTLLGETNSSYWRTHADDGAGKTLADAAEAAAQRLPPPTPSGSGWDFTCTGPLPTEYAVVDVLVLYTLGVYQQNDFSHPNAVAAITREMDDANDALRNSGITTFTFALIGTEYIAGMENYDGLDITRAHAIFSGLDWQTPVCVETPNVWVRERRDAYNADIVALARRNSNAEPSCGKAFIQNHTFNYDCPHTVGAPFKDFAYIVFDPDCGPDRLNLAHELGHQLGMEHDPRNSTGFVFGGSDASCPWSYGHRRWKVDPSVRFRSVMAYWEPGPGTVGPSGCFLNEECPQIDAFSTPALEWAGAQGLQSVGTVAGAPAIGLVTGPPPAPPARAVDTLQRLAPIVEAFWDRDDPIFANGFE